MQSPMLTPADPDGDPDVEAPAAPEEPRRGRSLIFPFRCWPLRVLSCVPEQYSTVQGWLHCLLLCGVFASIACLINIALALDEGECDVEGLLCFLELGCSSVVVISTCTFLEVIKNFDKRTVDRQRREEESVMALAMQYQKSMEGYAKHSEVVAEFCNGMKEATFDEMWDKMEGFLIKAEKESEGAPDVATLRELNRFVVNWTEVLSKARLVHVLHTTDRVDMLLETIRSCKTIAELRGTWSKGTKEIATVRVNFFWRSPQSIVPVAQLGVPRGARSRARCRISWLSLSDPNSPGKRPKCCRKEPDPEGAWLLDENFRPYTLHVLSMFCVRILSEDHLYVLACFLVDMAVMMLWVIKVEDWLSLGTLVVNATCILSLLLFFEQTNLACFAERRIAKWQELVDRSKQSEEDFNVYRQNEQAYYDMIHFWGLPQLQMMGAIEHLFSTDKLALEKAEEILRNGNECVESLQQSLPPPQDWLRKPLDKRWKDGEGRALRELAKMQDVKQDMDKEELFRQLLKTLESVKQTAVRLEDRGVQAWMFIQDAVPVAYRVTGDPHIAGLYQNVPDITNGGKPVYRCESLGDPMFLFFSVAKTEWKIGPEFKSGHEATCKGTGSEIEDVTVWRKGGGMFARWERAWQDAPAIKVEKDVGQVPALTAAASTDHVAEASRRSALPAPSAPSSHEQQLQRGAPMNQ